MSFYFGFIVIFLSSFTLICMISLSIRKRFGQISILRVIGYPKKFFVRLYIYYSILFSLISFLLSLLILYFLHLLNLEFDLMSIIFPAYIFFPFSVNINLLAIIFVFFVTILITLMSTLFSTYMIYSQDIIKYLNKRY